MLESSKPFENRRTNMKQANMISSLHLFTISIKSWLACHSSPWIVWNRRAAVVVVAHTVVMLALALSFGSEATP